MQGLDTLRKLDLYKKIPHDLTKGTLIGAFVSVGCTALIVYLMFAELVLYSNGSLETSIFVSYLKQEEDVPLRVNMTILDKSCQDVEIDIKNTHGHTENVKSVLKIQKQDDCNLVGVISIKKTSGAIVVVPHKGDGYSDKEYKVIPEDPRAIHHKPCQQPPKDWIPPENYKPPKGFKLISQPKNKMMNHEIYSMEFGSKLPENHRWDEVLSTETEAFKALKNLRRDMPVEISHDYQLKLVPTTFIDQNRHKTETYQCTYGYQNFILASPRGVLPPSIIFRYEISPMEIKYQYVRKPLYHLLTMNCAIIGGVVTVAGLIDKLLFNTHELIKQKVLIGKLS